MKFWGLAGLVLSTSFICLGQPGIGKVEIMRSSEIKAGMQGIAWTVFQGSEPEAMPVEIIGLLKNALGPKQDLIFAKLGGPALRTNVAGGMSGSPVYIDGKLAGAISRRVSVFSPDAICGITPIEQMLEVSALDDARPANARAPGNGPRSAIPIPSELVARAVAAGASSDLLRQAPAMVPIETPLVFSGFQDNVLRDVAPMLQQLGMTAVQGGGGGSTTTGSKPAAGWEKALRPGQGIAGMLVSGDMAVSVQGTVTYNDGRRVLAFGHTMQNFGQVEMPMSRSDVLMTLASSYQPNKFANTGEVVGAIRQDRSGGILGILGEQAETIPMLITVRSFNENGTVRAAKEYRFNVFVEERYTPTLIMTALYNTLSGTNEFGENTYRLSGKVEMDGGNTLSLATMQASGDANAPAPMLLAGWVGDRFNRLFLNSVTQPRFKGAEVNVDLLPERRVATIENAWAATSEAEAGQTVSVKVFLRPFRGERLVRDVDVKLPAGLPPGQHRILLSDADTLNRMQSGAGRANRFIDLNETISLINQERSNTQLYVSLLQTASTVYYDDKVLPSLPASALNVMQTGPMASRPFVASRETVLEQAAIPFDYVVSGSYSLTIMVK